MFAADTVYGLACDPDDRFAVERLYLLKRRTLDKPSAVMFFDLERALDALPESESGTRGAMARLLPGAVTVLVPNPAGRFALACGVGSRDSGSARAVGSVAGGGSLPGAAVERQSRRRRPIRARSPRSRHCCERAVDFVVDGGSCPGRRRPWSICAATRSTANGGGAAGAVGERELTEALHWQYHFDAGRTPRRSGRTCRLRRAPGELAGASGAGRAADPRARDRNRGDGPPPAGAPPDAVAGRHRRERADARGGERVRCRTGGRRCSPAGSRIRSRRARSTWSRARCACTT